MPIHMWVIYENPLDYPGKFVVRHWCGSRPDFTPLAVTVDLESARKAIPAGAYNLGREPGDDPQILEAYI